MLQGPELAAEFALLHRFPGPLMPNTPKDRVSGFPVAAILPVLLFFLCQFPVSCRHAPVVSLLALVVVVTASPQAITRHVKHDTHTSPAHGELGMCRANPSF